MLFKKLLTIGFLLFCLSDAVLLFAQPVNDDPCGAIVLVVENNATCIPANPLPWTDATATPNFNNPVCASYATGDVWYTFTLTGPSDLFITTAAGNGANLIDDGGMEIYFNTGGCNGTFNRVACDDDNGPGSMPQIVIQSIAAGTYYIRFGIIKTRQLRILAAYVLLLNQRLLIPLMMNPAQLYQLA